MKTTKMEQVRQHLNNKKSITSWEAITNYGATRLSAIIFNLREEGVKIVTEKVTGKDRNGRQTTFANYKLID